MHLMYGGSRETLMIRYECRACGMNTTMVQTDSSQPAWADHMATHDDPQAFDRWGWLVLSLPGIYLD